MSFDPTSIISLIQNCKTLYDYSSDVRHSTAERRRLLEEVRSLEPELQALQRLASTPGVAGDQASMERLGQLLNPAQPFAKVVNTTLGRVKDVLTYGTSNQNATRFKVFGKRGAAALWWTVDKAEVKDLLLDLERYKSRIGLAVQHDMFNHIISEYRLKIAKFISEDDFTGHQRSLIEQRLPETGLWVLRHPVFVAWRDNEDSDRTVWCHGFAGVGKSVIAAFLVDHLRSTPGTIVLSVFCRYDKIIGMTTPFPVLRGLLRQLIEKSPNVPPALYDLYRSQTEPEPDAICGFLNDLAASHARRIYIIIDALDECPIRIDLLRAVQELGTSFHILVTSRPVFGEIYEHSTIEIRAADEDILKAADTTLRKLKHTWLDEDMKDLIRNWVVRNARGMFLLASLQLRELERDLTRQHDVSTILGSLPRTLDEAYKSTFQRIREQGERKNELACRVLASILAMPGSTIRYVQLLVAEGDFTQKTDVETIVQCCCGLVKDGSGIELLFIHYSVPEYTTTHWSELFPEHPSRIDLVLELGYSTWTKPQVDEFVSNSLCWSRLVMVMSEPEEFKQVISLFSTPAVRAWLVEHNPGIASFVHDPLLVACYCHHPNVVEYMMETVPPDVERFNEALRASKRPTGLSDEYFSVIESILKRSDMRVTRKGVIVAVDPNGGEGDASLSEVENDYRYWMELVEDNDSDFQ